MRYVKILLLGMFAGLFLVSGVGHFANEGFFLQIMPDYIPQSLHRPAMWASGVFEIALGVLLLVPRTRRWAAWGLVALLIAVFPANIYAFQHSEEIFDMSKSAHFIRLPLQGVLVVWAYLYTRSPRNSSDKPSDD